MILLIDNYDSFTYNIAQYFQVLQQELSVYKNDEITIEDIATLNPQAIIIGPGPCTPDDAGITLDVIDAFAGSMPILGICLGHQAIGQAFGAKVVQAKEVMHGRISAIHHRNLGVFSDIPSPFNATRYHSLVIDKHSLPDCLQITAWTEQQNTHFAKPSPSRTEDNANVVELEMDEIMGIRHCELAIEGVQFHPESLLSDAGYQLLNNFLHTHGLATLNNSQLPEVG